MSTAKLDFLLFKDPGGKYLWMVRSTQPGSSPYRKEGESGLESSEFLQTMFSLLFGLVL